VLWTHGSKTVRDEILCGLIGLSNQVDCPLEPHIVRLAEAVAQDLARVAGDLRRLARIPVQDHVRHGEPAPFLFGLAAHQ
jgi:hypothetical protein